MPMTVMERKVAFAGARTRKTHTLKAAAERIGITPEYLRRILHGQERPSDRVQLAMADYMGHPRDEVFPREVTAGAA